MKLLGRFLLPLVFALIGLAYIFAPYAEHATSSWFEKDVEMRSQLVFSSVQDNLEDLLTTGNRRKIEQLFNHLTQDERLLAIGFCGSNGDLSYKSQSFPAGFSCATQGISVKPDFARWQSDKGLILISRFPLATADTAGTLVILHDLNFIQNRSSDARTAIFVFLLIVCGVASLITLAVANLTLRNWLKSLRLLIQMENLGRGQSKNLPTELRPVMLDLYRLLRNHQYSRRVPVRAETIWTSDSLRHLLTTEMPGTEVIVISNREPYIHNNENGNVVLHVPTSGLVSALEPVVRACRGTWIAQGSGSADKATVDRNDHIQVPPDNPAYTLRRMWLNEEEEEGYYHGFANEGLWPLCHLVFTRPVFREEHWSHYQAVNRKFADAVVAEAKTKAPLVLVQDYHFALLPALIRERLPNAIIVTFWHIPWPNSEAFSICPWREEILKGLLGSSILGFHTQFHCNNFFDTADRFLECRIDRERNTVSVGGFSSLVRPYPISIAWPPLGLENLPSVSACRQLVFQKLKLPETMRLGVGVERFDYTKGIMDRFQAVARFFRQNPEWIGKFTFVQVAAPTRSKLQSYRTVQEETIKLAEEINAAIGRDGWTPIVLIAENYEQARVFELFRAADLCLVSSLHDGMNLVAKEFVAAREDKRGALILSTFAGASEELPQALIVNPHDTKGMADAIHRALLMQPKEQEERMQLLRSTVRENNVYRWAGKMLRDAAQIMKSRAIEGYIEASEEAGTSYGFIPGISSLLKWFQSEKRTAR